MRNVKEWRVMLSVEQTTVIFKRQSHPAKKNPALYLVSPICM